MVFSVNDNLSVQITISYSNRKSIGIKIVNPNHIQVICPHRTPESTVIKVLNEKRPWLQKHLEKMHENRVLHTHVLSSEGQVLFMGKSTPYKWVQCRAVALGRIRVSRHDHGFVVESKEPITHEQERLALDAWMKDHAKLVLEDRLLSHSKRLGLKYQRLVVKDVKSRWGSCSSKGNINLNWRLIKAPLEVIDAICIHELCHLIHLNHSKAFWTAVENAMPNYHQVHEWLKTYGPLLY